MISTIRQRFNQSFSEEKYHAYLEALNQLYPNPIEFRVAETPIFIDKDFKNKILSACEHIVDVITQFNFNTITSNAIPKQLMVPNENAYPHFIAFDFGICKNDLGELEPQLIEMQGFPTLFCYQHDQDLISRRFFDVPKGYSTYFNDFTPSSYIQLLKEIIINDENPEQCILLEIFPHQQKTRVDFYSTAHHLGLSIVCLTEVIQEGKNLFYLKDDKKIQIKRIYNRVIFDELKQQTEAVQAKAKWMFEDLNVQWVPHPNWFYRISKYTLPFIRHPYVPETNFLIEVKELPEDLNNYVLKPLFSFAGQGVIIDVTIDDIHKISDPENWILQRKVNYAAVIETPDIPAKAEIRIFYCWPPGANRPIATNNLARLSKGKMIGVRYNADKQWVGGSLAYFEED